MANMAAGLNSQNFTQAQAAATGDINRQLSAATTNQASQQTDLTRNLTAQGMNQTAQQNKINSDINAASGLNTTGQNAGQLANNAFTMQNTAGAEENAQAQNEINAQMQKFQQAWGYPTQQLGVLQSALGMTPLRTNHNRSGAIPRRKRQPIGRSLPAPALARSARSSPASPIGGRRRTFRSSARIRRPARRSTPSTGRASRRALRRAWA